MPSGPQAPPRVVLRAILGIALVLCPPLVSELAAQRVDRMPESLVRAVMPGADRFTEADGDPPVISAYRTGPDGAEALYGYVFLTSDLPPEQFGYSGPIEALVGMRPDGTLTGMRVTDYRESYMSSMGDFLRTPGFQEQFTGKHIGDPFRPWGDLEGISRVSISVRALSRGVRDSARRVANAYGFLDGVGATTTAVVDPVGLSWFELRQAGVVQRFEVTEPGEGSAGISLAYISSDRIGDYFLGSALYERAQSSAARRGGADNLMLYAVDGSRLRLFKQQGWSITQDGDTTAIDSRNVVSMGLPSGGIVSGEATMVGIMLVDRSVDAARPFNFVYDLGDLGVHSVEYVSQEARLARAEETAAERAAAEESAAEESPAEESPAEEPAAEEAAVEEIATEERAAEVAPAETVSAEAVLPETPVADARAGEPGPTPATATNPLSEGERELDSSNVSDVGEAETPSDDFQFVLTEDETLLERTLAGTSWGRVATMLFVLALGTAAFFSKIVPLRWTSLSVTLVLLGFLDGGFLSVSHITSGIWAGVGVYLRDVPLLLIVTFTVVTTLIWGRVFCGFLCPFGALQDLIDLVVPKRFKRPLPQAVHDRAVYAKYGVLGLIVVPALLGSQASVYQYFEPFGTVFFLSPSLLLWAIAAAFLLASVVIPRFYCRYACPLGAALGVLSLVSLRRIARVEHCSLCKVCEQRCPTGAIRGAKIDFHECVRCNVCEVQLIERTGVCGHDLETIRPRLVQLQVTPARGATTAAPGSSAAEGFHV